MISQLFHLKSSHMTSIMLQLTEPVVLAHVEEVYWKPKTVLFPYSGRVISEKEVLGLQSLDGREYRETTYSILFFSKLVNITKN